jgi:K+/H+ antiporter YhaU regulatory subunit KhtT
MRRADESAMQNPSAETVLAPGDVVIVPGHDDDIPKLAERFSAGANRITYRGVTIDAQ